MKKNLTKSDLSAYLKAWGRVRVFERKELRSTSPSQKFRQFLSLMSSVNLFVSSALELKEFKITQQRWRLLRQRWHRVR